MACSVCKEYLDAENIIFQQNLASLLSLQNIYLNAPIIYFETIGLQFTSTNIGILNTILCTILYISITQFGNIQFSTGKPIDLCAYVSIFHYTKWTGHYSFHWQREGRKYSVFILYTLVLYTHIYTLIIYIYDLFIIYLLPFNHSRGNEKCNRKLCYLQRA